jgi:hypothetical protein
MKYRVVSGWNRGGTSCLMATLRECGIPVVGYKYPFEFTFDYVDEKTNKPIYQGIKKDMGMIDCFSEKAKDNNPSGFWEMPSICLRDGVQQQHASFGNDGNLIKVQLDCLASSVPDLVDRVVIILRNPFKVITSAIRCKGEISEREREYWIRFASLSLPYNLLVSLKWLEKNNIPSYIIFYKDLIEDPRIILEGVCDFMGRGEAKYGVKIIDKKLDRSQPVKGNYKELKKLKRFWSQLLSGTKLDWEKYDLLEMKAEIDKLRENESKKVN